MGNGNVVPSQTLEVYRGHGEEAIHAMHERLQTGKDIPSYIEIEVRYEQVRKLGANMTTFVQALESLVKILAGMNYRVSVEQPNVSRFTLIKAWSPQHPDR